MNDSPSNESAGANEGRGVPKALREIIDPVTVTDSPKPLREAGFETRKGVEY